MYLIDRPLWGKEDPTWEKVIPLLRDILGYTYEEACGFRKVVDMGYAPPLAINVNEEQVVPILQPFIDYDIGAWAEEYDDVTYEEIGDMYPSFEEYVGLEVRDENKRFIFEWGRGAQDHYYDAPILLKHQRVNPFDPPSFRSSWKDSKIVSQNLHARETILPPPKPPKPIVTCPYCKSENTTKITSFEKATNTIMFGIFGQKRKYQWHCNNCKSDF